ncbi:MAG: porin family protein [Ferruginibacter sp.]
MTKVFLSVAMATILMTGTAVAQHSSQKAAIGVKGGLNLYTIKQAQGINYDAKVGFNAGLLAHIHLVKHVALQPEIVYSRQGGKGSGAGVAFERNLDYINVPVLAQYMFDNGFRIEAGPQVGILVNATHKSGNTLTTDVKSFYKTADVGLAGGISYVHPASGFGVDLRYNLGLSNINKDNNVKSTNQGGQLGIFYLFSHRH